MNLTICVATYPPYIATKTIAGVVKIQGIFADLVFALAKYMNFTYVLRNTNNKVGIKKNSSFVEFIMMTSRGECDATAIPLGMNYELSQLIDFATPIIFPRVIIMTAAGQEKADTAIAWNLISDSPWVIGSLFLAMIIFAILLYISERIIWKKKTFRTTFGYFIWSSFGSLFLEPFRYLPRSISSRMLIGAWLFSVMVFLTLIGGSLKANIAVGEKTTIDSVRDLIARPHMYTYIIKGLPYANFLKISQEKEISAVYKRTVENGGLMSWPNYLMSREKRQQFKKGKLALIITDTSARAYQTLTGDCQVNGKGILYISKEELFSVPYHFLLRKGLPQDLREGINRKMAYFASTQQFVPSNRHIDFDDSHCYWKPERQHHSSSEVILIGSVWAIGMTMATFTLIVEICFYKFVEGPQI